MAVNNSLVAGHEDRPTEFECNGETVKLSPRIIREFLTSGGGTATDQDIVLFLNLCRYQHLNPFLREVYLIKYGNAPATIVPGKEVFTKRAQRNEKYLGQQAGVVVQKKDGSLEDRIGTLVLKEETLVGGWAKVFVKGYTYPVQNTVSFEEYAARKSNGEVNQQWTQKPATMIRKVALMQALREAFPAELQGLYAQEEMEVTSDITLDETPIDPSKAIPSAGDKTMQPIVVEAVQEQLDTTESDPLG